MSLTIRDDYRRRLLPYFLFALLAQTLLFFFPAPGAAITKWSSSLSMEDTRVTTPTSSSNLFQTALTLDVAPATTKQISPRLSARLNFIDSAKESLWTWNVSPVGNLGLNFDLSGDSHRFNMQHSNYAALSVNADLVNTKTTRAALSVSPQDMPRLVADYATTMTSTFGTTNNESRTDTISMFGDYSYKWLNFRGGYSTQDSFSQGVLRFTSDSIFMGTGGSYEILPRTTLSGDVNLTQSTSQSATGGENTNTSKGLSMNINSSPLEWLGFMGNFRKDHSETGSDLVTVTGTNTGTQMIDVSGRISPFRFLNFTTTLGNRTFDDVELTRSVGYKTVAATFSDRLRDEIQVGMNLSRSIESDPEQGDNIRDGFSLNSTMDLTPRISARVNFNIGRSENPGFVNTRLFGASGTLANRGLYNDKAKGFTYFDSANNQLYTKLNDPYYIDQIDNITFWSAPVFFVLITEQFSVSKSVQLNMIPTDKTSLTLSLTANSNAEELDLLDLGSMSISSSFNYRPNLRTSYSLSASANMPQTGAASYSTTASMAYRLFRGHQLIGSYSNTFSALKASDSLFGGLRLSLQKGVNLELSYGTAQLFSSEQTHLVRARLSKSF